LTGKGSDLAAVYIYLAILEVAVALPATRAIEITEATKRSRTRTDDDPRVAAARLRPPIPPLRNRKYLKSFKRVSGIPVAYYSAMSQPRQIVSGSTYLITRRALRRHYLLRPDYVVNNLFIFFFAVLGAKYGILLNAFCILSTHEHLIVTDTLGNLPDFLRDLHRLTALVLKVRRKWDGPIWDHEQTSVVHLQTPQAIVEKLAYVMANPTAVGAVRYAKDWPGLVTTPKDLGKASWTAKRPTVYLDQESSQWPEQATLTLQMPPMIQRAYSDPVAAIKREYEELQQKAREEMAAKGRSFMGADRVSKVSPYERAKSWEDLRSLNPVFAVGRGQQKAKQLAIKALKAFRSAYREALKQWRGGNRMAEFPLGTWWMATFHGAPVADTG
jgi:putative transposase